MHYSLTPYIGVGTDLDPFRPLGSEQPGWSAIDLRPDPTVLTGRALLALPIRNDLAGQRYLGDDPWALLPTLMRTRLGNDLGLTLAATRFRDIVAELLIQHARTDGTRWRPLRASRARRRLEVWLGGLLWSTPVVAGGASYTESWTAADSADLDADQLWTEDTGAWSISTNKARANHTYGRAWAVMDSALDTDDHYAQATLITFTLGGGDVTAGVNVRRHATITTYTDYSWEAHNSGGTTLQFRLIKWVTGSPTVIDTDAQDPALNDVLYVSADGSTITGKVNGITLSTVTDTGVVDNLRGGIEAYVLSGGLVELDTWSAADLAAAAKPKAMMMVGVG